MESEINEFINSVINERESEVVPKAIVEEWTSILLGCFEEILSQNRRTFLKLNFYDSLKVIVNTITSFCSNSIDRLQSSGNDIDEMMKNQIMFDISNHLKDKSVELKILEYAQSSNYGAH